MDVSLSLSFTASLNVRTWQRTWQRKWRDVLYERQALANEYTQHRLWDDELTRRVETFFKACRELGDWLKEATGLDALAYLHASADLQVCDAVAQTAKHLVRNPNQGRDPITAIVATLSGTANGPRAYLSWTSVGGRNGQADALDLADRCIAEWEKFLQQNGLDGGQNDSPPSENSQRTPPATTNQQQRPATHTGVTNKNRPTPEGSVCPESLERSQCVRGGTWPSATRVETFQLNR